MILAESSYRFLESILSQWDEVIFADGRNLLHMTETHRANLLLIRSTTAIDKAALSCMPNLAYIGSATTGIDHIVIDQAKFPNIRIYHASGANSHSVAEYVFKVCIDWLHLGMVQKEDLIAVVGCGHIGSKISSWLGKLGFSHILVFDPFLSTTELQQRCKGTVILKSPDSLTKAKMITFHVPLTKTSYYPTFHYIPQMFKPRKDALLINTSRGGIISEEYLIQNHPASICLDVFENEPTPSTQILKRAGSFPNIATPHIAGYSLEGRWLGYAMVLEDVQNFLNIPEQARYHFSNEVMQQHWNPDHLFWEQKSGYSPFLDWNDSARGIQELSLILNTILPLQEIQQEFTSNPAHFDKIRKEYNHRHEFSKYPLRLPAKCDLSLFDELRFPITPVP